MYIVTVNNTTKQTTQKHALEMRVLWIKIIIPPAQIKLENQVVKTLRKH